MGNKIHVGMMTMRIYQKFSKLDKKIIIKNIIKIKLIL